MSIPPQVLKNMKLNNINISFDTGTA